MHALGCLFFLFIIGFFLIIALVRGVLSFLFGGFSRRGGDNNYQRRTKSRTASTDYDGNPDFTVHVHYHHGESSSQTDSQSHSQSGSQSGSWTCSKQYKVKSAGKKKLIGEDEGEYVDFEEVK